jgi:hypothetical protein
VIYTILAPTCARERNLYTQNGLHASSREVSSLTIDFINVTGMLSLVHRGQIAKTSVSVSVSSQFEFNRKKKKDLHIHVLFKIVLMI